jgi:hypothetical protein
LLRQIARLALQFGDRRIESDEQRRMMLYEWRLAFGRHNPTHLHEAVSAAITETKFWPTIAEIMTHLKEIRRECVLRLEASKPSQPDRYVFARDGRTDQEEVAYRKAQCARWREEAKAATSIPPTQVSPASESVFESEGHSDFEIGM